MVILGTIHDLFEIVGLQKSQIILNVYQKLKKVMTQLLSYRREQNNFAFDICFFHSNDGYDNNPVIMLGNDSSFTHFCKNEGKFDIKSSILKYFDECLGNENYDKRLQHENYFPSIDENGI